MSASSIVLNGSNPPQPSAVTSPTSGSAFTQFSLPLPPTGSASNGWFKIYLFLFFVNVFLNNFFHKRKRTDLWQHACVAEQLCDGILLSRKSLLLQQHKRHYERLRQQWHQQLWASTTAATTTTRHLQRPVLQWQFVAASQSSARHPEHA